MIKISYVSLVIVISVIWTLIRVIVWAKNKKVDWKRELELVMIYICIIVVARFTFFPFSKVDGIIQPLILDVDKIYPFRINIIPVIHLFKFHTLRDALLNIIGNIAMFIPIGIVLPRVYKKLNTHKKVIVSGIMISLSIEILQIPFYDRVSDIDDLILNSVGFLIGYSIYILIKK